MNINQVTTAIKVCDFTLATNKKGWLDCDWTIKDKSVLKDPSGRVYLLVIDGDIMKIGGSADKGGIKRTLTTYASGNCGRPSIRTYGICKLMKDALENNSKVECYMITSERVVASVKGLFGNDNVLVAAYKEMESKCVEDFVKTEGCLPSWNFQEAGIAWDKTIQESHAKIMMK